ncbi:MAG: twin-arginine translocase TatA/TatE family subunit [bacterium]|nr:twin-arginine translocase TatA/TatE family subunit [bacterium]
MNISFMEIMVICIVALVVLGPDKLPIYAHKLGVGLKEFKKVTSDLTNDIKENMVEPLNEAAKPLKDAVEPLTEIQKEVKESLNDVTKSINDIGKE